MATLLLRLAAPLQSWGMDSKFETRKTNREPTKSGIIGLLSAALGLRRDETEEIEKLNQLRFAVRVDQEGSLLIDYHTAGNSLPWKSSKQTYVTQRHYLCDAVFLVGLESDDSAWLEQLEEALRHPAFPLFLGRRSCPPTQPLCLGICPLDLLEALRHEPPLVPDQNRTEPRTFRICTDAEPGNAESVPVRDLPISFSPIHRQYGYRAMQEIVMTEPSVLPGETTHDPFTELG